MNPLRIIADVSTDALIEPYGIRTPIVAPILTPAPRPESTHLGSLHQDHRIDLGSRSIRLLLRPGRAKVTFARRHLPIPGRGDVSVREAAGRAMAAQVGSSDKVTTARCRHAERAGHGQARWDSRNRLLRMLAGIGMDEAAFEKSNDQDEGFRTWAADFGNPAPRPHCPCTINYSPPASAGKREEKFFGYGRFERGLSGPVSGRCGLAALETVCLVVTC